MRTPKLFQLGSTLVDAGGQQPKPSETPELPQTGQREMTPAARPIIEAHLKHRAIIEALLKRQERRPGRPTKKAGRDYDTLRATVIYLAAQEFPPGELSIRAWIEKAQSVAQERGPESRKLFLTSDLKTLEQSVSRGLKKMGVKRGWNNKNLRKKHGLIIRK